MSAAHAAECHADPSMDVVFQTKQLQQLGTRLSQRSRACIHTMALNNSNVIINTATRMQVRSALRQRTPTQAPCPVRRSQISAPSFPSAQRRRRRHAPKLLFHASGTSLGQIAQLTHSVRVAMSPRLSTAFHLINISCCRFACRPSAR